MLNMKNKDKISNYLEIFFIPYEWQSARLIIYYVISLFRKKYTFVYKIKFKIKPLKFTFDLINILFIHF